MSPSPSKVVVFDALGSFAHFKRFYTTSSPTSYAVPPRTALQGLIGSILGYSKNEYLVQLDDLHVGVALRAPVKRIRLGTNWINTKDGYWRPVRAGRHQPRTPIPIEFLKDAHYRIYVSHNDSDLIDRLESMLKNNRTIYTPCLGTSECLATLRYISSTVAAKQTESEEAKLYTAVPSDLLVRGGFSLAKNEGAQVFKERLPSVMEADRSVSVYREVIFEAMGRPLHLGTKGAMRLESGEVIAYL